MAKILNFNRFTDTLRSFVGAMGGTADKAASTYYDPRFFSPLELLAAYRSSWVARKIVNIPAFDAFREWRSWQAEDTQIEDIENEEKRLDLRSKLMATMIRARLYGGCALYIGTSEGNPAIPLEPARIGKGGLQFLTILPRTKLQAGQVEEDPMSPDFGCPLTYEIRRNIGIEPIVIHKSRLVIFTGENAPTDDLLFGWGDSILNSCMEAIKNADATAANIASLVFEAKVDVIKIPQMMANLTDPHYEATLMDRFALANRAKGISATVLLDAEEEYEQKTANFGTLPEVLMSFFQIVSGAADIPATRFLGQSPAGLNATGDADMRNYYDRIKALQNVEITPAINNLDECLIRSALGSRPEDIWYEWASLWQTTEKEKADIGYIAAQTLKELNDTALYPQEAIANAGINMLTEFGVMPGLQDAVEEAGGLPDYDMSVDLTSEEQGKNAAQGGGSFGTRPVGKATTRAKTPIPNGGGS